MKLTEVKLAQLRHLCRSKRVWLFLVLGLLALYVGPLWRCVKWALSEERAFRKPDVAFITTPQKVVDKMLELAEVTEDDLLYDLGCGDARINITAAQQYGCRGIGYDISGARVEASRENVLKHGVEALVQIERADVFTLDLSPATVITLYLLPELNVKLIPQLEKLPPGVRIVSHDFDMKGVIPDQVVTIEDANDPYGDHWLFLWTTPLNKEVLSEE